MTSTHSRSPSTPISRSTSMVGKIFQRLRTPSSSSSTDSPPLPNHNNQASYSTPSLANSSKSSLADAQFTGFQHNASRSTLGLDDEFDVAFPELESSPFKNAPPPQNGTPLVLGSSNPFGKSKGRVNEEEDQTVVSRPSSSLDRREEGRESSALRSIGKSFAKGRDFLTRSASQNSELDLASSGAKEAAIDSFKSPPAQSSYASLSSRHALARPTPQAASSLSASTSAAAAAASSSSSSLLPDTTPALSRGLTASTVLPKTAGNTTASKRPWLERRAEQQRDAAASGRTLPRPMRAKRAVKGPEEKIDMMAEAENSQQQQQQFSSQEREQRTLVSRTQRPPTSPGMHGRSRSELPPASPKMAHPHRDASTITINPTTAATATAAAGIDPSTYLRRVQERSASAQGMSSLTDLAPARSASALGTYSRTSPDQLRGGSSTLVSTSKALPPNSAAALRQRFLRDTAAASSSSASSPDASSSNNGYSPSSTNNEPSPPSSQGSQGAYGAGRSTSPEVRRAQQVEKAAQELADLSGRGARPASPGMMPYASRAAQQQSAPAPARTSPLIPQQEESTLQPQPTQRRPSFDEPQHQQSIAPYQDENAYAAPAPARQPMMARPQGRVVLAESYRSTNNPPPHQQQPQQQHQQYAPQPTPAQAGYAAPPNKGEYSAPLRDRSPGMAEVPASVTHQQHHYASQQQQQQQQQYQQQQMYHPHQQQQQPQQQAYYAPQPQELAQQQPKPKKGQSFIIVNGKAYARAGLLGKGGSSRVYRVLDPNNHLFAIKRVDISKNDAESRASFINEIALLERLRGNAQIIHLVDSEINDQKKQLLMVMEVGETDLHGLLIEHSGKPISMNFIRYIWEQMLRAVKVIHDENVVHTDLKPANFVIVKGQLKLIDFGISKAIGNDTTNIGRDQQIGSANYMPPEALLDSGMGINGKRLMKLGRAADVWSLGCILHQMVYGRTPFSHLRDVGRKIMAIQNPNHVIEFPAVATVTDLQGVERPECRVHLGPDLIDAMQSCLIWDPKRRATIPELLEAEFLRGAETPQVRNRKPTLDEETMRAIVERVGAMVGGGEMREADVERLAGRLMRELGATATA